VRTNSTLIDRGQSKESHWPDGQLAAKLRKAGVTVAVGTSGSLTELRFHASMARKGGMSSSDA